MLAATLLATAIGPIFGSIARDNDPPQPYTETVKLPGNSPQAQRDLHGAWMYDYREEDAALEDGRDLLLVTIYFHLHENGTYELLYSARWGGFGISPTSKGLNVRETGTYSVSRGMLMLKPETTVRSEITGNTVVSNRPIANENHVLIAHVEKAKLHVAGRCAQYQIDPACRASPNIWFSMKSQLGRRWLQRR